MAGPHRHRARAVKACAVAELPAVTMMPRKPSAKISPKVA